MRRWLWLMGVFVWAGVLQAQDRTEVKPDGTRITSQERGPKRGQVHLS
jgi:hypothetical protein